MNDNIFFGIKPGGFEGRSYYICQTAGYDLWLGLRFISIHAFEERGPTHNEYKEAYQAFPFEIKESCRCKQCRYTRMYRRLTK